MIINKSTRLTKIFSKNYNKKELNLINKISKIHHQNAFVTDNICVINCFCLLLSMVMVIEVAGGAMACIFLNQFKFAVESGMNSQLVNFNEKFKFFIDGV